jgi:NADH-quinone oxidoreductase subunit L
MIQIIYGCLAVPFIAGIILILFMNLPEKRVHTLVKGASWTHSLLAAAILIIWLATGQRPLEFPSIVLYQSDHYVFMVSFLVDSLSCLWLFMTAFFGFIAVNFSASYLHKDPGYQRFFAALIFMIFGQTLLAVANSLDILMVGWEFVGICSFLLISFYYRRNDTVKNGFKVLSVYRFCDSGILLSAWLTHVLWHKGYEFYSLRTPEIAFQISHVGFWGLLGMTGLILLAAAGKSAQFPFTFWLSRAMEGPTPSSAIFYGALSVHAGAFLLLRTIHLWHPFWLGPWLVASLGLLTAFLAHGIARVQSNVKGQVAYHSAAHVGLIFVEIALGLKSLAMMHMFMNASLRCFQLLVSPSAMVVLLRQQRSRSFREAMRHRKTIESFLPKRLSATLYVLASHDGFLEELTHRFIWAPMKIVGRFVNRYHHLGRNACTALLAIVFVSAFMSLEIGHSLRTIGVFVCGLSSLILTLSAMAEYGSATAAWSSILGSNLAASLSVVLLEGKIPVSDILAFASGILVFGFIGHQAIYSLQSDGNSADLGDYHGLAAIKPKSSLTLLISALAVSGFPVTLTYVGQDLLLHHAVDDFVWLAGIIGFTFSMNGLAALRVYIRLCLGHANTRVTAES